MDMSRRIVFGNLKYKVAQYEGTTIILPKFQVLEKNFEGEKGISDHVSKKLMLNKLFKDTLCPSKQVHGCSALLLGNNKIAFTLHTTKKESMIWNERHENIKVDENDNPIEYVNGLQLMDIGDFIKYFKLSEPSRFLETLRFGPGHQQYDLAYCAARALWKSISQSQNIIELKLDLTKGEKLMHVLYDKKFIVGEGSEILTPAEIKICGTFVEKEIAEQFKLDMDQMAEDNERKLGLIKIAQENYDRIYEKFI